MWVPVPGAVALTRAVAACLRLLRIMERSSSGLLLTSSRSAMVRAPAEPYISVA